MGDYLSLRAFLEGGGDLLGFDGWGCMADRVCLDRRIALRDGTINTFIADHLEDAERFEAWAADPLTALRGVVGTFLRCAQESRWVAEAAADPELAERLEAQLPHGVVEEYLVVVEETRRGRDGLACGPQRREGDTG